MAGSGTGDVQSGAIGRGAAPFAGPALDYAGSGFRPWCLLYPPWVSRVVLPAFPDATSDCSSVCGSGEKWMRSTTATSGTSISSKSVAPDVRAPPDLHLAFDTATVKDWRGDRFQMVSQIQEATRNQGKVHRMEDTVARKQVAVKVMPNSWACTCHDDFIRQHPEETELPWLDIGCTSFLNKIGYEYGVPLLGVYRNEETTSIVSELASDGDLFGWCGAPGSAEPGRERERHMLPLAWQIVDGVRQLHDMSIVHRDLSLENFLVTRRPPRSATEDGSSSLRVQVIDFGMTSTSRMMQRCVRGKPSYMAPELHGDEEFDGFLADAFSVGVTLYALLVGDYPWLSTRPGGCKCFEFVRRNGFRAYVAKRKTRGGLGPVGSRLSEAALRVLEGLLEIDPAKRLTLGEAQFEGDRRSVWDEAFLRGEGA